MNKKRARHKDKPNSYHSFLKSLIGKMVTIYRGGPESKTGILLDACSDFITLYAQDKKGHSVVYYKADHVKSISEDSKSNSMQPSRKNKDNIDYLQADNFIELLMKLENETIKINQGGPESKHGTLLAIGEDYLILYTDDDGIVYYNIDHIKSISKYKERSKNIPICELEIAEDFQCVFRNMAHKWVSINRGGPEAMEGVLVENAGGHYTLVKNEEVLRIHPYHIRSISSGPKGSLKPKNDDDQDKNKKDDQDKKDQDKNKKDDQDKKDQDKNKKDDQDKNKKDDQDKKDHDKYKKDDQDKNKKDDQDKKDHDKYKKDDQDKKDHDKYKKDDQDKKDHDKYKKDDQDKKDHDKYKKDDQDKKDHDKYKKDDQDIKDQDNHKREYQDHNKRRYTNSTVIKSIDYIWKGK